MEEQVIFTAYLDRKVGTLIVCKGAMLLAVLAGCAEQG